MITATLPKIHDEPPRRLGAVAREGLAEGGPRPGRLVYRALEIMRRGRRTQLVMCLVRPDGGREMIATDCRTSAAAAAARPARALPSPLPDAQPITAAIHCPETGEFWTGTGRQNPGWRFLTGPELLAFAEAKMVRWRAFVI